MEAKPIDLKKLDIGQDENCRAFLFFVNDKSIRQKYKCDDHLDVVASIRQGLPYATVDNIIAQTRVSRKDISSMLHISTRQMNRYAKTDLLSAEQSGFIYEFSRIYVRGLDIFGDQATFENWLQRPQMALGMQVPVSLLDTTEGFRLVNDLLSQIEYGFYS